MKPQWVELEGASFHLKALSSLGKMSLIEHGNSHKGKRLVFDAKVCDEALREVLIDWKDVNHEDGVAITFNIETALEILPHMVISGLMTHVFKTAFLEVATEKKS